MFSSRKRDEFQVPGSKRPRKNEFDFRKNKKPRTSMIKVITTAKKPDAKKPKPKFTFLSSKQRLKVEKNQRRADRVVQKENEKKLHKSRKEFMRKGSQKSNDSPRRQRRLTQKEKDEDRKYRQAARVQRQQDNLVKKQTENQQKELQLIKDQYLGKKKRKKTIVPPSQKFKFNFDWEPEDDTSEYLNQLYANRANVTLQFGKWVSAGIDKETQKKANKAAYRRFIEQNRHQTQHKTNAIMGDTEEDKAIAKQLQKRKKERKRKEEEKQSIERLESRHWSQKRLEEMKERDWRILKEDFQITTKFGGRLPYPIRDWKESNLSQTLLKAIREVGYKEPTPIQRQSIPVALENRDIVGIAETGSGKTAAFVLPMLSYLLTKPQLTMETAADGPYALVLAPTRELANQIAEETTKFAKHTKIRTALIVGGVPIEKQAFQLREGVEVIIATPGRLNDCIVQRYLVLNQCNYVVLDEADRMIDMGFEPQVVSILDEMPSTNLRPIHEEEVETNRTYRQTFMFSATMPPSVERLTRQYLRNPVYVTIGDPNSTAAERVRQTIIWTNENEKRKKLKNMMESMEPPIMVFCNMKKGADSLAKFLRTQEWKALSLHGGKKQDLRQQNLEMFKENIIDVLVCTNVAGRGIDIKGVEHVINYDMPNNIQDYCHRIGRTGRAGLEGNSVSFLTNDDTEIMYDLKKMLLKTGGTCPPELMAHEASLRNPNAQFEPVTKPKKKLIFAKK